MWQTKYASAAPINLGLGFDFQPCSEGDFLIGPPKSVLYAMLNSEREFLMLCPFNFVRFFYKILIQKKKKKEIRKVHKFNLVEQFFIDLLVAVMISKDIFHPINRPQMIQIRWKNYSISISLNYSLYFGFHSVCKIFMTNSKRWRQVHT